jgi:hypothetical protein
MFATRGCRHIIGFVTWLAVLTMTAGCGGSLTQVQVKERVLLVPSVDAGWAGWCMLQQYNAGGCGGVTQSKSPIIAETWSSGGPPPMTIGYALTMPQVAAVSVRGGPPIKTQNESVLPSGIRSVVVRVKGKRLPVGVSPNGHRRIEFTPLDAVGKPIQQSGQLSPQLGFRVATRSLRNPAKPTEGVCPGIAECKSRLIVAKGRPQPMGFCSIEASGLSGLLARGGSTIVGNVQPISHLLGHAFLTCASTSYTFHEWYIIAAILLNASRVGRAPWSIPGMRHLPGRTDVYEAIGSGGEMLVRRIHAGWLIVAKGANTKQRLAVLEHLHAAVHFGY